ncbi:hypothetical protein [Streptomyces sp. NPDC056337]|uniref:hypothetical protein n=1 Tax=Streptomyces sp. NPDC056337 TaxID=3345787 RepID=UPI0035E06978
MLLQLPQPGTDALTPLREALGKRPDVDERTLRQRQDVRGQPDRGQRQLTVLGEVITDDDVLTGLVRAYVDDTGVVVDRRTP